MKIPMGENLGFRVAQPQNMPNANPAAFGVGVAESVQRLGNTGMQVAEGVKADMQRKEREAQALAEKQQQENIALARAKAANSLLDREITVKTARQQIEQGIADGSIHYEQAQQVFDDLIGKLELPQVDHADPVIAENLAKGAKRIDFTERSAIDLSVVKARKADHKNQVDAALDKLGKLAGMPGAEVDKIIEKASVLDGLGKSAYGQTWDKKKQDFIDANWTQHATQRAIAATDNLEALKQLQSDLSSEDGYYAGKLDADKRSGLLRGVMNDVNRLENKIQHQADKRETSAERVLNDIDKQISTGIPAMPEQWAEWADKVKGTSFEPVFRERVQAEVEIQDMLKKPINEQLAYVRQQEQSINAGGASIQKQQNFARLKKAVDSNIKELSENPLQYNQVKTGAKVAPLDIVALGNPSASGQLRAVMTDRLATIDAMRRQYGDIVQARPFLPEEAKQITQLLSQATPKDQVKLFGNLHAAIQDTSGYMAAMRQIAPDSPVTAMAGMIYAKQQDTKLESKLFKDDIHANSGDIAETLLIGESILNKTKDDKATDGKAKSFPLPSETDFRNAFSDAAGNVFAGRTGAYEVGIQAVRAYYAGKSMQDGDVSGELDSKRMKYAIRATLGEVVDVNGNGEVLAPWGMSADDFEEKSFSAFKLAATHHKLPPGTVEKWKTFGLRNIGDGTYYVTQGRSYLTDSSGKEVIIDVNRNPQVAVGKIKK